MANPDIAYLKQIGDFCVTYGPWAVAIFEGLFILKLIRDHKKERADWEEKRSAEREFTVNKFQEYHDEIVNFVNKSTKSTSSMASKMVTQNSETKNLRKAMEQFCSLIMEGVVKIKPAKVDDDITKTIGDFMPDTCLDFSPIKKKKG
jgi:hypothetical protein